MNVVTTHCTGLDVHQATVVGTIRIPDDQGGRRIVAETFGTMTPDLLALRDWLQASVATHGSRKAQAFIGSRCTTFWRMRSPCSW